MPDLMQLAEFTITKSQPKKMFLIMILLLKYLEVNTQANQVQNRNQKEPENKEPVNLLMAAASKANKKDVLDKFRPIQEKLNK